MKKTTQETGQNAELLAQYFLQEQGLIYIRRNVHFKTGEIDLVMQDKHCLVFIEVRYRQNKYYGSAAESITISKQKKLIRSALLYCQKYKVQSPWRIDVVAITPASLDQPLDINWIPSAITS